MDKDDFERLMGKLKADMERPTLANKVYWHSQRLEKAYVAGDEPAIRMIHRTWAGAVLILVAWVVYPYVLAHAPWWLGMLVAIPILYFAFTGTSTSRFRASAYRAGWLDGRRELYEALRTGRAEGVDVDVILTVEQTRDLIQVKF